MIFLSGKLGGSGDGTAVHRKCEGRRPLGGAGGTNCSAVNANRVRYEITGDNGGQIIAHWCNAAGAVDSRVIWGEWPSTGPLPDR